MSAFSEIYDFLKSKLQTGARDPNVVNAWIAGIMGNLEIESGFNSGAYNAREGAIGIAQWEGGRRTALQAYAQSHGGHETELSMQLGFMWQEMNSNGALTALYNTNSASSAATAWDTVFERSSGTTRGQRISAAEGILGNKFTGPAGGGSGGTDAGAGGGGSAGANGITGDQYTQDLGPLAGALSAIPELAAILQQAESGNWSLSRFENAVQNSEWYRTHADSIRQGIALQSSDPATYAQNLSQAVAHVHQLALRMGVNLSSDQLNSLGTSAYLQGLDDPSIQAEIGGMYGKDGSGGYGGQSVSLTQQLTQLASQYGVPVTSQWINGWVQKDLVSGNGLEGATADLIKQATSLYPGLAQQLKDGQTTLDVAQPYMATMSSLLELPQSQVKLTGTLIQRALQYKDPTTGTATPLPLWQFQDQLRQDPRWDHTDNARQTAYELLNQVGSEWGFSS